MSRAVPTPRVSRVRAQSGRDGSRGSALPPTPHPPGGARLILEGTMGPVLAAVVALRLSQRACGPTAVQATVSSLRWVDSRLCWPGNQRVSEFRKPKPSVLPGSGARAPTSSSQTRVGGEPRRPVPGPCCDTRAARPEPAVTPRAGGACCGLSVLPAQRPSPEAEQLKTSPEGARVSPGSSKKRVWGRWQASGVRSGAGTGVT